MQKLRRFMGIHERFEPILVAECEDHAAGDVNNWRLRLLDEPFSPLRVVFDEHRGGLLPVDAPSVRHFTPDVAIFVTAHHAGERSRTPRAREEEEPVASFPECAGLS